MAQKFQVIDKFLGYQSRSDRTNTDPRYLVSGSQNVLINDQEKVATRGGYTVYGGASTTINIIISAFDWKTAVSGEKNLRSHSTVLEVRYTTGSTTTWETLEDGFTSETKMQFATWFSPTGQQAQEVLLFVANDSNIYEWSGGQTTYASSTATTITKEGTSTWRAAGFFDGASVSGGSTTRQIRVKDTGGTWRTFTYTGGEGTTTLTGVTPDPTTFTFAAGALALQEVRSYTNEPASSLSNDFIANSRNQIYIGQDTRNIVYITTDTDFTSISASSPRVPGEGATLTLDAPLVGFGKLGENVIAFCGQDFAYKIDFIQSQSSTTFIERVVALPLKIGAGQGARSQDLIGNIGDAVVYVTREPALRFLSAIDPSGNVALKNMSDPIKPDFDDENFANAHIKFHKNRILIATPTNDKLYILQIREDDGNKRVFWQPPQILPVRMLADIAGDLYGHSSRVQETYQLFTGTADNGLPMQAKAVLAYRNFGDRANYKEFDEWVVEGFIASNTTITHRLNYELDGSAQQLEKDINGSNDAIIFGASVSGSLGDSVLGGNPLGTHIDDDAGLDKFKIIHEFPSEPFFEIQEIFETNNIDRQWEIVATGPNARISTRRPTSIKQ